MQEGIIDSTGILELVFFLEENFGVSVEDDELVPENFDSLKKIVKYLEVKTASAPW
jgi:acyl carrier protein